MSEGRQRVATLIALAVVALLIGALVPAQPGLAIVCAIAVLALGVSALEPTFLPLCCVPLLFVVARIGAGSTDLSVSDAALAGASAVALVLGARDFSPAMRNLLWLVAVYQASTLFTVLGNPYAANVVEWAHTLVLVGGALIMGWSLGRAGHGALALHLMIASACLLSLLTISQGVLKVAQGDLTPVYVEWPYSMHKNFVGTVLAMTAVIVYVQPDWLGGRRVVALSIFWWLAAGIAFTQSRQAVIGLGVVLLILILRSQGGRRRSRAILAVILPAGVFVLTAVREQLASGNEFNSAFQRLSWFSDSLAIWETSPIIGVGLRWWYTDTFDVRFQPPNAELEVLTSAGVVGLIGFLVLMIGAVVILWRVDPRYGTLAALVVLSRLVQGQFDLFWVTAQSSLPFVIAGICLGVHARHGLVEHSPEAASPGRRDLTEATAP